MDPSFAALTDRLEAKYQALTEMTPSIAERVPSDTPKGGVYLFSENGVPLYAGRTKRKISLRIRGHFSTAKDCPFAWLMSRESTKRKATYRKAGSRAELLADPEFLGHYEAAKTRIRKMDVRYVHEPDPIRQALLEVYVAVVSKAKYNDFDTH
jgi:hypothetical protein